MISKSVMKIVGLNRGIIGSRAFLLQNQMTKFAMPQYRMVAQPQFLISQQAIRSFAYDKKVIDHYENPRNVGSMKKSD